MIKPRIVIKSAVVFRDTGMVWMGIFMGGMLWDSRNPANTLPIRRRLIELIS